MKNGFCGICLFFLLFFVMTACGNEGIESAIPPSAELSSAQQAWETGVLPDSPNGTHQWLFARGLEILRRHADLPGVRAKLAWLDAPGCLSQVRQGLFDADFLSKYTGARWDLSPTSGIFGFLMAVPTYAAHFYDPDSGKTYTGKVSPTADEMIRERLDAIRTAMSPGEPSVACHELGVASHFMGDIAQPMHAALFTGKNRPIYLHGNIEGYAMDIQDRYLAEDWDGTPSGDVESLVLETAVRSKQRWPDTFAAIRDAYQSRGCWFSWRLRDNPDCWQGDAALDGWIGESILDAQVTLARFLYLVDFAPTQDLDTTQHLVEQAP